MTIIILMIVIKTLIVIVIIIDIILMVIIVIIIIIIIIIIISIIILSIIITKIIISKSILTMPMKRNNYDIENININDNIDYNDILIVMVLLPCDPYKRGEVWRIPGGNLHVHWPYTSPKN